MSTATTLWSETEIAVLADRAYKNQASRCPRCAGPVQAELTGYLGRSTTPVYLSCERCGASAEYSPDHLEAMELQWSQIEKVKLVEEYWTRRIVHCPNDGATLKIIKSQTLGPPPPDLLIRCPHCGRHFWSNEVADIKDPESFEGKYEIDAEIGQGGMGVVVLARQRRSGERVAAKRILPRFLGDAETVKRFLRESRILEKLSHPNVVAIRETFINDKGGVIVMDYVEGGTLTDAINSKRPSADLLRWSEGVVDGLIYLHRENVVHRDLKPGNILLDGSSARISDFGLARLLARDTTTLTAQGGLLGTWLYAAPEQHDNPADVGPASDIYSLGVVAYEVATGRSPYRQPMNTGKLSPQLVAALEAALDHDASARPTDGRQLLEALRAHFGSGTTAASSVPP